MKPPADETAGNGPGRLDFDPARANLERMQAVFAIFREEADYSERMRTPRPAPAQPAPNETIIVSRPRAAETEQRRRGGAGVYLFFVFALIALAMGAVYGHRNALSEAFPQYAPALEAYAAQVQQIKLGLRGFLGGGS